MHTEHPSPLFDSIRVGHLTLPNRIVMAPMTRNRAAAGNIPRALNVEYYRQRASAGLIITEASQVMPEGQGYPRTPGIHNDEQVEGWKPVTSAVHEAGGRIFLQLWHVGRISHPVVQPGRALPVAPSAIRPEGQIFTVEGPMDFVTPRALETEEIPGIVAHYADGARRAVAAGFDGVEIHGANGYLVDQFLRDGSNHRTDRYGGTLENRLRFMTEVTQAVCEAIGADRVGIRLSPTNPFNSMSDSDPVATFTAAAKRLDELGLAYLHVLEGRGGDTYASTAMREIFHGPFMVNAGYTFETASQAIASGQADLVSFGSLFLANPDLPRRFLTDAPLNAPDPATYYGGDAAGYTDYPALSD